tara:strand:- start:5688 stop:6806 length:1119 start_codon:yes stop_codon:yes gene_type:complete
LKKRIAIITTHPIQYQVPLFKKLSSSNIRVDVFFASKHSLSSKLKDKGFNKKFNWDIDLLKGYNYFFSKKENNNVDHWSVSFDNIEYLLSRNNYNAILIFGWSNILYLKSLFIAKKLKIKTILRVETNLRFQNSIFKKIIKFFFLKFLFSNIDFFLVIGKLNKQFYKSFKIKNSRLFNAPYFVDNNFFKKKKKLKSKKKTNFLFVGKLIDRKNPLLFIKIAEKLKNKKNLHFNIVGSGPLFDICKEEIKIKNLRNVSMLGFKNQKELRIIYSKNDYLILTSIYETWGLVVNESMASGLPVISSLNCGATHDLIKNNHTGFIYKNPENLVRIILNISNNKKIQKKLIKNVKKKIKRYTINKTVIAIKKIVYSS